MRKYAQRHDATCKTRCDILGSIEQRGDVRTKGDVMQHHRYETAVDWELERIDRLTALDATERKQAHDMPANGHAGREPNEKRY